MSSERTDAPESDAAAVELTEEAEYWPAQSADELDVEGEEEEKKAEQVKLYEAAELSQNYEVALVQGGTELNLGFRVCFNTL